MTNNQTKELTKEKLEDRDSRIQNMLYIDAGTQPVHIRYTAGTHQWKQN